MTDAYVHCGESRTLAVSPCHISYQLVSKMRRYNFREGWCVQSGISHSVNISIMNGSLVCIAQTEALCVLNCRPTVMRWQGRKVRDRAAAAFRNVSYIGYGRGDREGHSARLSGMDSVTSSSSQAIAASAVSLRIQGTPARPPKAAHAFAYSLSKKEQDHKECCRKAPQEAKCELSAFGR